MKRKVRDKGKTEDSRIVSAENSHIIISLDGRRCRVLPMRELNCPPSVNLELETITRRSFEVDVNHNNN